MTCSLYTYFFQYLYIYSISASNSIFQTGYGLPGRYGDLALQGVQDYSNVNVHVTAPHLRISAMRVLVTMRNIKLAKARTVLKVTQLPIN